MEILHVTDCDSGGVPEVIDTILDHLPGQILFIGDIPAGFRHRERIVAALGRTRSKSPFALRQTVAQAARAVKGSTARLIHGHSSFGGVYGALLSRRLDKPFIYTPHASPAMIPVRSLADRFVGLAEIISCRQAASVIACSDDEASVLRSYCRDDRLKIIPNGVASPRAVSAEGRGWDILFVGRISSQKRPDLFVQLAQSVKARRPATRIGWVGPGCPLPTSAVEWIGSVSERQVFAHLTRTRIYASVSDYEGLSLASLRAACAGCELALRDTIGNRSPVTMGASGFLFSDIDSAAARIATCLDDVRRWTTEEAARRRMQAEALFSVDRMIATLQSLYAAQGSRA